MRVRDSDEWHRPERLGVFPTRVLAMVGELHRRGYQRLRILPGISGSGVYWRVYLMPVESARGRFGFYVDLDDPLVVRYSEAQENKYFDWRDAEDADASELADLFVQRFPKVAERSRGRDWAYAGWFVELLGHTTHGWVPYAYSDWLVPEDYDEFLPMGGWHLAPGRPPQLPVPPLPIPGDSLDVHVYVTLGPLDEILELVVASQSGYHLRRNRAWVEVDADPDDSPVWGSIETVSFGAIDVVDASRESGEALRLADIQDFVVADPADRSPNLPMTKTPMPCDELLDVLLPAFAPCPAFSGPCARAATWDPVRGHVPRGFVGATAALTDVRLVLVTAEPGDPHHDETYPDASPDEILRATVEHTYRAYRDGTDLFHRNVREILDSCWPQLTFDQQLERVWLIDAYLCSARVEGGSVPVTSARHCADRYLKRQLELMPGAAVVALGAKATKRVAWTGASAVSVRSAAPPGCHYKGAKESWNQIPTLLTDGDTAVGT